MRCWKCGVLWKWHIEHVGCWGCVDVRDVGYWGGGMFGIWDAWDVGYLGCGMFGMCYVRDVEELNGIEIDGILKLKNLSKTVFID